MAEAGAPPQARAEQRGPEHSPQQGQQPHRPWGPVWSGPADPGPLLCPGEKGKSSSPTGPGLTQQRLLVARPANTAGTTQLPGADIFQDLTFITTEQRQTTFTSFRHLLQPQPLPNTQLQVIQWVPGTTEQRLVVL